jgi:hypothetical protein
LEEGSSSNGAGFEDKCIPYTIANSHIIPAD